MRLIEKILSNAILFACVCMATYMTYLQFNFYLNNDDLASISYRRFNEEEKDQYPKIALCMVDRTFNGKIFDETHAAFNSNVVTPSLYKKFLQGLIVNPTFDFSTIQYDDVVHNIHDGILLKSVSGSSFYMLSWSAEDYPFALKPSFYQLPIVYCFEKHVSNPKNSRQYWDAIHLNASLLYNRGLTIFAHVHQKGRLMRNALQDIGSGLLPNDYKNGLFRLYDINDVEVLRKRSDSNTPCDEKLIDEDEYLIKKILSEVGCIPTFWEKYVDESTLKLTLPRCKKSKEYGMIYYKVIAQTRKIDTNESGYIQPCTQMKISVTTRDTVTHSGHLTLQFMYNQNVYKEIVNTRAYTHKTLLSQIGGFVGIKSSIDLEIVSLHTIMP